MRFENCINEKAFSQNGKAFFCCRQQWVWQFFVRRDLCLSCRSIAFVFNQKCGITDDSISAVTTGGAAYL